MLNIVAFSTARYNLGIYNVSNISHTKNGTLTKFVDLTFHILNRLTVSGSENNMPTNRKPRINNGTNNHSYILKFAYGSAGTLTNLSL